MSFNVIVDTREKICWDLASASPLVDDVISRKLDTGDYCVEGLEDLMCFERKKSVSELATNITKDAFERELIRMSEIEYSFLMLEFSVDDILKYPVGSDIPKKIWRKLRVKSEFIMSALARMQTKYQIHVVFCGDSSNAALIATNIMGQLYRKYN